MIYRAPERAVPARSRAVTHELAALLVGMALVAALVLQVACAGTGGPAARWLCINNARLAALRPTPPAPTATLRSTRGGAILPAGGATPSVGGAAATPSSPDAVAPSPFDGGRSASMSTPDPFGFDAGGAPSLPPTPTLADETVFDGGSPFNTRRATMTALAVAAYEAATARAGRAADVTPTAPTVETPTATTSPSQTPGPGTPSVTPGASPTGTPTSTQAGYPQP